MDNQSAPSSLPAQDVVIRAYKDAVPPTSTVDADLVIRSSGNGSWFQFSGTELSNGKPAASLNDATVAAAGTKPTWIYRRLEIFTQPASAVDKKFVLILPTIAAASSDEDYIFNDRAFTAEILHLKCHFQSFISNQDATIAFELKLTRSSDNGRANGLMIAMLKLGDTMILKSGSREAYSRLPSFLQRGGGEDRNGSVGLFLLSMNSGDAQRRPDPQLLPWTNCQKNTNALKIRYVDGVYPTLAVDDEAEHICPKSVSKPEDLADSNLGGLVLQGGCSVKSLTQRPSEAWLLRTQGSERLPWLLTGRFALGPFWNSVRLKYQQQLVGVRPNSRLSFIPELRDSINYDEASGTVPRPLEITLAVGIDDEPSAKLSPQRFKTNFLTARLTAGTAVVASFDLGPRRLDFAQSSVVEDPASAITVGVDGLAMNLSLRSSAHSIDPGVASRVGALDLTFSRDYSGVPKPPASPTPWLRLLKVADAATSPRLAATLVLPVATVDPGGQDGLPGTDYVPDAYTYFSEDRRDECEQEMRFIGSAPVVFPDPSQRKKALTSAGAPSFWVKVVESNPPAYSQTVSIDLHSSTTVAGPPQRVFVLDSDPFLVAAVDFGGLHRRQTAATDVVARWNTGGRDGAGWQLFTEALPFSLTLPPQSLGEEMPRDNEMATLASAPLEYRFSGDAKQTLAGSYTPQNFTEAPWNLRRLLGFAGQRDAGVGVVELQYELLYGLSCVANVPMLRLAELFATVGAIPGRLVYIPDASDAYKKFRRHWSEFVELYNSRVAMLEPRLSGANYGGFIGAAGASAAPQVLTLTDGVKCSFRTSADLAYPAVTDLNATNFPDTAGRLRGGATWGFESPRVYHATIRKNESTSALVSRPYLSSVGGSGYQKASFDSGLTSVYSDTAVGRTFFYSIERLGRISVYNNRARHVIEYGRSVEHSTQFPQQSEFGGRPVLRKLREYVQILEPKIALSPGKTTLPEAGCVKSIEFKRDTIPVTSAWGSNVGEIGWKVPLWVRGAEKDANGDTVYTIPEIVFHMAGAEGADVECVITEPEKLFFYTQTSTTDPKIDADPHLWPPVEGLDFSPMPTAPSNPPFPSGDLDQESSYDTMHPIGLRPFTLAIEEGQSRINLVYGRTDQPMGAMLHSVTIQRLSGIALDSYKNIGPLGGITDDLNKAVIEVRDHLFNAVRVNVPSKLDPASLTNQIDAIRAKLPSVSSTKLKAEEERLLKRWNDQIKTEVLQLNEVLASTLVAVNVTGANVAEDIKNLKSAADHTLAELELRLASVAITPNALAQFAATAIPALTAATSNLEKLRSSVTSISLPITDSAVMAQTLKPFRQVLDQLRTALNSRVECWMPNFATLADVAEANLAKLRTALSLAGSNVGRALDDIKSSLVAPAELTNLSAMANGHAVALTGIVAATTAQLDSTISQLTSQVLQDPVRLKAKLAEISAVADGTVKASLASLPGLNANFEVVVNSVLGKLPSPEKLLTDAVIRLEGVLPSSLPTKEWARQAEAARRDVEHALDRYAEGVLSSVPPFFKDLPAGNTVPALLQRAFGAAPRIPNLDFSIPQGVGYFYDEARRELSLTPLLSQVSGLGAAMSPLATRLPSMQVLERMIPKDLKDFDLSRIFPKFAGLDLANLFPCLKMPVGASDHIHLTHGFDNSAKRAWVQVDISLKTDSPATLFSIGPLAVQIPSAAFTSTVRMEADAQGKVVRTTTGAITGEWHLLVGGSTIITLLDTSLTFNDSGQLHFEISPKKVKLSAIFKLLEDAIKAFSPPGSGFSFLLSASGIETRLALPIPPVSFGTSGITNLSFSFLFGIEWAPTFAINAGFSLGRRDAPFNISIFVLGGGGYFEAITRYVPGKSLSCSVDISLAASASLAISLGPISGGVSIFLGTEIHFESGGGGSDLRVGIYILITGQISVLGIVSAYVGLRLEATYGGGQFIGRGTFTISITICWCFTLNVSQQVTMSLGGGGNGNDASLRSPFENGPFPRMLDDGVASDNPLPVIPMPDFGQIATLYINMLT